MRKCLLVFGLLSTLLVSAQTKKPVYKKEAANGAPYAVVYSYPQKTSLLQAWEMITTTYGMACLNMFPGKI